MTLRKQRPDETDAEYALYLEARKLDAKAYRKAYYETNKECELAYRKAYADANKDSINSKQKARYAANKVPKKVYYEANKESIAAQKKVYHFKSNYGLTPDAYETLIANGCNVCGTTENLCVDHCHATGKVRGCLCNACNLALGYMKDDPTLLRKLTDYIEVHHEIQ